MTLFEVNEKHITLLGIFGSYSYNVISKKVKSKLDFDFKIIFSQNDK